MTTSRLRRGAALAAVAALVLSTAACSGEDTDEQDAQQSAPTPNEPIFNPCDGLDADQVGRLFGETFTVDAGTETAPLCVFKPSDEKGPAVDANYMVFPEGLDAVFDEMPDLDPKAVSTVRVKGADDARIVVDSVHDQLLVSGFVQTGDLIQTVDVVDPKPYAQPKTVAAVRGVLGQLAKAAPKETTPAPTASPSASD